MIDLLLTVSVLEVASLQTLLPTSGSQLIPLLVIQWDQARGNNNRLMDSKTSTSRSIVL